MSGEMPPNIEIGRVIIGHVPPDYFYIVILAKDGNPDQYQAIGTDQETLINLHRAIEEQLTRIGAKPGLDGEE